MVPGVSLRQPLTVPPRLHLPLLCFGIDSPRARCLRKHQIFYFIFFKCESNTPVNIWSFRVCFGFPKSAWPSGGSSRSEEALWADPAAARLLSSCCPLGFFFSFLRAGSRLEILRFAWFPMALPAWRISGKVQGEGLSLWSSKHARPRGLGLCCWVVPLWRQTGLILAPASLGSPRMQGRAGGVLGKAAAASAHSWAASVLRETA